MSGRKWGGDTEVDHSIIFLQLPTLALLRALNVSQFDGWKRKTFSSFFSFAQIPLRIFAHPKLGVGMGIKEKVSLLIQADEPKCTLFKGSNKVEQ